MTLPHLNGTSKLLACMGGVLGGWTLQGVLSCVSSTVAIIVGGLHVYDWIKKNRRK